MATQSESQLKLVITGEHQQAAEALDAVAKLIGDIAKAADTLATRLADATKTFADFGRGITEVKDAVSSMSGSMTRFGTNVNKQAEQVAKGSADIVKSMGDINKAVAETASTDSHLLKDFADAQNSLAMASYEAANSMKAETDALRAQTEATRASTSAARQYKHDQMLAIIAVQMIGASMVATGMKGADMFVGAIKSAMDFQAMMARVGAALKTTGGDTAQNIQNLSNLAMVLDQTSLYSMNNISDMMQALAKQGLTYQQIYSGAAKATITLAQATDTSLTDTATVITDMTHEFNLSGSQLTPVINGISGAMHQANISMTDFYNSMKYVGPIASQLGLNFNDVSQAIGELAQHGIKGSQAGTTLRRMLMNLQPSTKAATAEFKTLGLETKNGTDIFYNANGTLKSMGDIVNILHTHLQGLSAAQKESALRTMFGVYALSGMEVIANTTTQRWDALTKSMADTKAMDVAKQKMDNLRGHLKEFTSTLQTIGTQMATFMMPFLDKIVGGLQNLAGKFKDLSPWMQHAIFIIVGIGSALAILIGTLLTTAATLTFLAPGWEMIGAMISGVGTKIMAFATTTIPRLITGFTAMIAGETEVGAAATLMMGPWGIAIAAIIAIGALLLTHWLQFTQWIKQNFGIDLPQTFGQFKTIVIDAWINIQRIVQQVWNYIGPTLTQGIRALSNFWLAIWPNLKNVFQTVWNAIKIDVGIIVLPMFLMIRMALGALEKSWKYIWGLIVSVFKLVWDAIVTDVKVAWDLVSGLIKIGLDLLNGNWRQAWTDMKAMVLNIWNDMKDGIGKIVGDLGNIVMNAVHALISGVLGAFQGLVSGVQHVWQSIVGIFSQKIPAPQMPSVPTPQTSSAKIPHFASGGLVNKPTIALVGEAGPEMIVPLNGVNQNSGNYSVGLPGGLNRGGIGGGGNTFHFASNAIVINVANGDANQISRQLKIQLQRALT